MAYLIQNGSTFKSVVDENENMVEKVTRKMSTLLENFRRRSSNDLLDLPETERPLSPVTDTLLTSDLTVHLPVDGKFTAEVKLKKQHASEENVVLRVSDGKLEIFFTKKYDMDQEDATNENLPQEENKRNRKWFSRKNIFKKFGSNAKKRLSIKKMTVNRESLDEKNFLPHGFITLPDYILTETLTFSLNNAGDLNIQADVKGAIKPSYIFKKKTLKPDNSKHSVLVKWFREHTWSPSEYAQQFKNAKIRPRSMSEVEAPKSGMSEFNKRPTFSRNVSAPMGVNWMLN